jgi:glycosyltransferase involved in cell wall biosynthesis
MAYGLPVIAANVGAAPEIVYPGENGYLIEMDDDISLANYIAILIKNRVQLANLAYHARQRYDSHPTWTQSMQNAYLWLRAMTAQHKLQ